MGAGRTGQKVDEKPGQSGRVSEQRGRSNLSKDGGNMLEFPAVCRFTVPELEVDGKT
jgi:hypothetical protein